MNNKPIRCHVIATDIILHCFPLTYIPSTTYPKTLSVMKKNTISGYGEVLTRTELKHIHGGSKSAADLVCILGGSPACVKDCERRGLYDGFCDSENVCVCYLP